MKVRLRLGNGLVAEGVIHDISSSGALIMTCLPVSLYANVRVELGRAARRPVAAQIVRMVPGGFAVEWGEFSCEAVRFVLRQLARAEEEEISVQSAVLSQHYRGELPSR